MTPIEKNKKKRFGMTGMAGIISAGALIAFSPFASENFIIGVALGGFLMTLDIYLLKRVIVGLLGEEPKSEKEAKRKRRFLVFQYVLKVVGLLVILAVLVLKTKISPAGLLVGVTAAIIGPMYVGLRDANEDEQRP
jgi:hypothetical protein